MLSPLILLPLRVAGCRIKPEECLKSLELDEAKCGVMFVAQMPRLDFDFKVSACFFWPDLLSPIRRFAQCRPSQRNNVVRSVGKARPALWRN